MDIVHIILLTPVIQAAGVYYESSAKIEWYNAIDFCNIALPDIDIQESGNYIDTQYEIENDKVWIGYFRTTTSFEYIGCTLIDNLSLTKTIPIRKNTPGLCYTFCRNRNNIAGISGDKCYCLSETPKRDISESRCNFTCDDKGVACGGNGYISLYKARKDIKAPAKEESCYTFQNNEWSGWKKCSDSYRAFCIKNNTILDKGHHTWNEYTNLCFSLQGELVPYRYNRNITNATGPSWNNIVSSTSFYTYKDALPGTNSWIEFGYVSQKKELKFEDDETERMRVLCFNETSSSDVNESSTNIGVPIGISVAVLVLTVCVILAFLYKRRGGKLSKCCMKDKNPTAKPESERSPSIINVKKSFENSSYDHSYEAGHTTNARQEETAVNRDSNYAHTYMVVEDDDRQPEDEGSTYNSTTATRPRFADVQDTNVYNTLDGNATYDGVHSTKMVAKGLDETYNTLTGATYAQTTSPKGNTTDEDTYNHMNSNSVIYNKSDNSYDISKYPSGLKQSETYSHLIGAPRTKTEKLDGEKLMTRLK